MRDLTGYHKAMVSCYSQVKHHVLSLTQNELSSITPNEQNSRFPLENGQNMDLHDAKFKLLHQICAVGVNVTLTFFPNVSTHHVDHVKGEWAIFFFFVFEFPSSGLLQRP